MSFYGAGMIRSYKSCLFTSRVGFVGPRRLLALYVLFPGLVSVTRNKGWQPFRPGVY